MVRSLIYLAPLLMIGVSPLGMVSPPSLAQTNPAREAKTSTPAVEPSAAPTAAPQPLFSKPATSPPPPVASPAPDNPSGNPPPLPIPSVALPSAAATVTASLRSSGCSNRLLGDLQPSQPVAIGRENYNSSFYLEGTTQPGYLTCGLTNSNPSAASAIAPNTLGALQQVTVQFGLPDNLPPTARATVAAYIDGKLWRSVTLRPRTPATTWQIPAMDKKSLTLEVACPGNCTARVYFTQADLEFPVIIAATPPEPPPEAVAQERRPEDRQTRMRRLENTFRILNWVRIFMPF